jgi:tetratricopeptide (TPR) repeat protein
MSVGRNTLRNPQEEGVAIEEKDPSEKELWQQLPQTDGEERAEVLLQLAQQATYRGAGDEALALAETASEIYESLGARAANADIANAYTGISYSLKELRRTEAAVNVLGKAVDIYRKDHYPFVDDLLRTQAIWYGELGDWQNNLNCQLEAVRVNEIDGNHEWLSKSLYNVAVAYGQLKNYPEAITTYRRARELFKEQKAVVEVARCDESLAEVLIESKEGADALLHIGRALDVAQTLNNDVRITWCLYIKGEALSLLEQWDEAEEVLASARFTADRLETDWNLLLGIETAQATLYRATGRAELAADIEGRLATVREILGQ